MVTTLEALTEARREREREMDWGSISIFQFLQVCVVVSSCEWCAPKRLADPATVLMPWLTSERDYQSNVCHGNTYGPPRIMSRPGMARLFFSFYC